MQLTLWKTRIKVSNLSMLVNYDIHQIIDRKFGLIEKLIWY